MFEVEVRLARASASVRDARTRTDIVRTTVPSRYADMSEEGNCAIDLLGVHLSRIDWPSGAAARGGRKEKASYNLEVFKKQSASALLSQSQTYVPCMNAAFARLT